MALRGPAARGALGLWADLRAFGGYSAAVGVAAMGGLDQKMSKNRPFLLRLSGGKIAVCNAPATCCIATQHSAKI